MTSAVFGPARPHANGPLVPVRLAVRVVGHRRGLPRDVEHLFETGRRVLPFQRARLPSRRPVRAHRRPAAGDRPLVDGLRAAPPPDAAGRDRHGKTADDGPDDRASPEADARPRPQQDAGRPAVLGVPRVLPGQRGRVLRQLLRLLPARGVPAAVGHVHREGLQPERGDRPAPPRRHPRAVRAARRDHRRVRVRASTASARRSTTAPRSSGCASAASTGATPCCATSSTSSTSATTRRSRRARFRVRGDTLEIGPASVGDHRPGRVLRRRGRADHGAGPADRASCSPSARS